MFNPLQFLKLFGAFLNILIGDAHFSHSYRVIIVSNSRWTQLCWFTGFMLRYASCNSEKVNITSLQ